MFVALAVVATAAVVVAVVLTREGKPGATSPMAAGADAGADAAMVAAAAASVPDVAAVNVVATDVAAVDVPEVVPAPAAAVETAPAPDAGPQPPEGSVLLAAGGATFPMGRDGATPAEGPAHEVTLRPFYLDRTEVTRERYRRCVDAGRCEAARGGGDDVSGDRAAWPVTGVTFVQAEAYCGWIGRRLPAEAEFEFAIRGVEGRLYPWGSVWKDGCSNSRAGAQGSPRPIGTSGECGATPEGVVDLLGNVWEFVSGPAEPYPGGAPLENAGAGKVLMRGHSYFNTDAKELTGTFRMWVGRTMQGPWLGFRCAADAP
jgi:formylglycine-generating enzyme required for sulfatase activity